jgi:SAM-dependent methyltransferase
MTVVNDYLITSISGLISDNNIKSICDYGCGEGKLLKDIASFSDADLTCTGIDHFGLFPEDLRPVSDDYFTFIDKDGDGYKYLFDKKIRFDLIFSTFAFHHFQYPVRELRNIESLLNPNGFLYLADYNFTMRTDAQMVKSIVTCLGDMFAALQLKYHRHHYTLEEARDLMKSCSLKLVEAVIKDLNIPESEMESSAQEFIEYLESKHNNLSEIVNPVLADMFNMNIEYVIGLLKQYRIEFSSLILITAKK